MDAGSDLVLPDRLVQFVAGMGCAAVVRAGATPRRAPVLAATGLAFLAAVAASSANLGVGTAVLWTVPCAGLVLLVAGAAPDRSYGPATAFGRTSYSFYLVHQPLLLLLAVPARSITTNPVALLVLGATAGLAVVSVAAWVFFRAIEQPSHRFSRRVGVTSSPPRPSLS